MHGSRSATFHQSRASKPHSSINSDRKSTRLNSSHLVISYAVFCLKKKKTINKVFRKLSALNAYRSLLTVYGKNIISPDRVRTLDSARSPRVSCYCDRILTATLHAG